MVFQQWPRKRRLSHMSRRGGGALDLLGTTATELQAQLAAGHTTSVELVEACLAQIDAHNTRGLQLHAVASLAPRAILLDRARALDAERAAGHVRGPLHGLPVIIKDAIVTAASLGMTTQAGTVALEGAVARKNASIVDQLLSCGMIVLAKASMTELCGHRGSGLAAGYSAAAGQTQSPYIRGGKTDDGIAGRSSPGGSSSGSAVGVAAGFAPLAVGTETAGSLVLPANRAGLFALRLTQGCAPMDGVLRLADRWDTVGPMAKGAVDVAFLAMALADAKGGGGLVGVADAIRQDLSGLRLGFVPFDDWMPMKGFGLAAEDIVQMREEYVAARQRLKELGALVVHPLPLPFKDGVSYRGKNVKSVTDCQFRDLFQDFTASFEESPVRSLKDLVEFNQANADRAMPEPLTNQKELIGSLHNTTKAEDGMEIATQLMRTAREGLADAFNQVDIIVAPSDCMLASAIAAAGYTAGVVPLGYLRTCGQPQGLTIAARDHEESKLLRFMIGFERHFPKRKVPPLLR